MQVLASPVESYLAGCGTASGINWTERCLATRSATAFVNESGITHILPFARQALIDLSTRVFRAPVVMPIFGPDELQFELPSSDNQSAQSE